jgi:hypothetical protein
MFRRDDGVIGTRARGPADAPTGPFYVRFLAVCYVLAYAVQPVAFFGLTALRRLDSPLPQDPERRGTNFRHDEPL